MERNVYEPNYQQIDKIYIGEIVFEKNLETVDVTIFGYTMNVSTNTLMRCDYWCELGTITELLLSLKRKGEPIINAILDEINSDTPNYPARIDVEDILGEPLLIEDIRLTIYKPWEQDKNGQWHEAMENGYIIENLANKKQAESKTTSNIMKKAMIVTMGTGTGVENGITFSIKHQNPDYICFIYSKDSEKTVFAVLEKIGKTKEEVDLRPYDEVNDVEMLYQEYSKYLDKIISKGYKPNEIVADYTSGTKSMSAALVSAAISKEIGVLSYVYGLRDEQGRVISNTERSSPFTPTAIFTEQKIKLFKQFFDKYQFDSALSLLVDTTVHHNFKKAVDFYKLIAEGYAEWDRFNFKKASELFNQIDLPTANELQLKKTIEAHKVKLHKLKQANEQNKLSEDDIIDLFSSAYRRYEDGKYDDGVARLYRLVEMVAQIEFEKEFNTTTDKVSLELLPEGMKEKFVNNQRNNQVELGLIDTFHLLNEKTKSKRAKSFFEKIEDFKKLLYVRNHSRLAHGQIPISKETCEKLISFVENAFELKEKTIFPKLQK